MIDNLSPPTRKILAFGLLAFLILAALEFVIGPAVSQARLSVEKLEDIRFRLARLETQALQKEPAKARAAPSNMLYLAENAGAASANMSSALFEAASNAGLTVEQITSQESKEGASLVRIDFSMSGDETSLMNFMSALEQARPLIRLKTWSVEPSGSLASKHRLNALAVAAWKDMP